MSIRMAEVLWDLAERKADRIEAGTALGANPDANLLGRGVILREWLERFPEHKAKVRGDLKALDRIRRALVRLELVGAVAREGKRVRILDWDKLEGLANGELYLNPTGSGEYEVVRVNRGYEEERDD